MDLIEEVELVPKPTFFKNIKEQLTEIRVALAQQNEILTPFGSSIVKFLIILLFSIYKWPRLKKKKKTKDGLKMVKDVSTSSIEIFNHV